MKVDKYLIRLLLFSVCLIASSSAQVLVRDSVNSTLRYHIRTIKTDDGRSLDQFIVPGRPPLDYRAPIAALPGPNEKASNVLPNVPAYDWSYGCSATSGAMMAGYYDNTDFPDMYTGPTNDGVMPMDNSAWGYLAGECPLSATHLGYDGRTTRGHVDDYWINFGNTQDDPYIQNGWEAHEWGDCTADFMKTNQSYYGNSDGATTFYNFTDGSPLYWFEIEEYEIDTLDGGYGLKLFFESRGYEVVNMFNQYIKGYGEDPELGFTWENYKAEIDSGRVVMIHVEGHSMLGFGYGETFFQHLIYLHDTWDYYPHTMSWGGSYEGMRQFGVSVFKLAVPPQVQRPQNLIADASSHEVLLSWDPNPQPNLHKYVIQRGTTDTLLVPIDSCIAHSPPDTFYLDQGLNNGQIYYYAITAVDSNSISSPRSRIVSAVPNAAPVWSLPTAWSFGEDDSLQIMLGNYLFDDSDPDSTLILNIAGGLEITAILNNEQLMVLFKTYPDSNSYIEAFYFSATDPHGLSARDTITVSVYALNDPPMITSIPDTIAFEDSLYTYQVLAEDIDVGDHLYYNLLTAPDDMTVTAGGLISWLPPRDAEGYWQVSVEVEDDSGATAIQSYQLFVENVWAPPVLCAIPDTGFFEDHELLLPLEYFYPLVEDPGTPDSVLLWLFQGGMNIQVELVQGTLHLWSPPDWYGVDTLMVDVSDGALNDDTTWAITVWPLNDTPVIISEPPLMAVEDSLYRYQLQAQDIDIGDHLYYSLPTAPVGMLIDAGGLVQWLPDNDDVGDTLVLVTVTDDSGAVAEQTFSLIVQNVNDPPVLSVIPDTAFAEDANLTLPKSYFFQFVADPDDPDESLAWKFTTIRYLSIDVLGDFVQIKPQKNWHGTETITVIVSDGALADTSELHCCVWSVNDPPKIISIPVTAAIEDELYQYQVIAFDHDIEDHLHFSLVMSPARMKISSGGLVTWQPLNEDVGTTSVTVKVMDDSSASFLQTYPLTVQNVNDPPVLSQLPDCSFMEDGRLILPWSYFYAYVYDPDNAPESLTWQFSSTRLQIEAGVDSVTFSAAANWFGSSSVRVQVSDGEFERSNTFQIEVLSVNDPPVIISQPDTLAWEDSLYVYQVIAEDVDPETQLHFALDIAPTGMQISALGVIQWLPGNADVGDTLVFVTVTDDSGALAEQTFSLTVQNVNDPPLIISVPVLNAWEDSLYLYQVEAQDIDVGDELRFNLIVAPGKMQIDATGLIHWLPGNDDVGDTLVQVQVLDQWDAGAVQMFSLYVNNMNDPPQISSAPDTVAWEDALYTYQVQAQDIDIGDHLHFVLDIRPVAMKISSEGFISWIPSEINVGDTVVSVAVFDDLGATVRQIFGLEVRNVNDAPVIAEIPPVAFDEDQTLVLAQNYFATYISDPDNPDSALTWTFIDTAAVQVAQQGDSLHFSAKQDFFGSDSVLLIVSDGQLADSCWLRIEVTPVNDAPYFSSQFPDSLVLETGSVDTLRLADLALDVDNAEAELLWTVSNGHWVLVYLIENGPLVELTVPQNSTGRDTLQFIVSDGYLCANRLLAVIIHPSTELVQPEPPIPEHFALAQNYPNPFNPVTTIGYSLPLRSQVVLNIYNLRGEMVITLIHQDQPPGAYRVLWNGRDALGNRVCSGMYFYQLVAEAPGKRFTQTRKMLLLQ